MHCLRKKRACGDAAAVSRPYGSFNRKVPKGCPMYGWRVGVRMRISRHCTHGFGNRAVRNHLVWRCSLHSDSPQSEPMCSKHMLLIISLVLIIMVETRMLWKCAEWWHASGGHTLDIHHIGRLQRQMDFRSGTRLPNITPSTPTFPHTTSPNP